MNTVINNLYDVLELNSNILMISIFNLNFKLNIYFVSVHTHSQKAK